ncbi:MAG TPA: serine protease [Polyangiaceae bacterium]
MAGIITVALAIGACGAGNAGGPNEPRPKEPRPNARADAPGRPGRLSRAEVVGTLSRGLGDFLGRLEVEPVLVGGRFRGWRVVSLRQGDPMWNGVDLAPGDIVTSVNGRPIERPEQALTAFQSLAIAKELRIAYERGGARRELVYPIDDPPSDAR